MALPKNLDNVSGQTISTNIRFTKHLAQIYIYMEHLVNNCVRKGVSNTRARSWVIQMVTAWIGHVGP